MREDISTEELEELQDYLSELEEIERDLEATLTGASPEAMLDLEVHPAEVKEKILKARNKALSTGYALSVTISNILQRFRGIPSKLLGFFLKLVNRFISLISQYFALFKIDSVQITISLTPSIAVTLKP